MKLPIGVKVIALLGLLVISIPLFLGMLYVAVSLVYGGGEDHTFSSAWQQGIKDANNILISDKICSSDNACVGKEIIAVRGIPAGFEITIYGVKNYELLNRLAAVFTAKFAETPDMQNLRIKAYPFSAKDYMTLPFWQQMTPRQSNLLILNVEMNRRKP